MKHNGREYLTVYEFSKRKEVAPKTIYRYIEEGKLSTCEVDHTGKQYLDWETESAKYEIARAHKINKTSKNKRKTIGNPTIQTPEIENAEAPSVKEVTIPEEKPVTDLSKLNPDDYPDCWIMDGNKPLVHPVTGQKMLDYDRLKLRLTSEKYELDIAVKRGEFVAKSDVILFFSTQNAMLRTFFDSIPQRHTSELLAYCERKTGHSFTTEEKVEVQNILKNETERSFHALQEETRKFVDEQ